MVPGSPASLLSPTSGADCGVQQGHSFKEVPLNWPHLHRAMCLPGQREVKCISPQSIVVHVKGIARNLKRLLAISRKKEATPAAHQNSSCPCINKMVSACNKWSGTWKGIDLRSQDKFGFFQILCPWSRADTQQDDNTAVISVGLCLFPATAALAADYSADINQWNVSMISFSKKKKCWDKMLSSFYYLF